MISPETYIENKKDMTYQELLKEKEILLEKITDFEKGNISEIAYSMNPSPDTIYQCNLMYLSKLCTLIADKYKNENINN